MLKPHMHASILQEKNDCRELKERILFLERKVLEFEKEMEELQRQVISIITGE